MSPADILKAATKTTGPTLSSRRPKEIDLSEIPERPLGQDAERGKFAGYFRTFPLVEIAPDLAHAFSSSTEVNDALRLLLSFADKTASYVRPNPPGKARKKVSPSSKVS
jgi:hypothetical protein